MMSFFNLSFPSCYIPVSGVDWAEHLDADSCLFRIQQPGGVLRLQHLVVVLHTTSDSCKASSQLASLLAAGSVARRAWRLVLQAAIRVVPKFGRANPKLASMRRLSQAFDW